MSSSARTDNAAAAAARKAWRIAFKLLAMLAMILALVVLSKPSVDFVYRSF